MGALLYYNYYAFLLETAVATPTTHSTSFRFTPNVSAFEWLADWLVDEYDTQSWIDAVCQHDIATPINLE